MNIWNRVFTKKFGLLAMVLVGFFAYSCGKKSGSGTRDTLPDFDSRSASSCFGLPAGEVAEFVGWVAAAVKLDQLSKVCKALNSANFTDGVSSSADPVDVD
jgi:hypothetical protein